MGKEFTVRLEDVEPRPKKSLWPGQYGGEVRHLLGEEAGHWVSVTDVPAGYYFEAHYHDVDQFQIIIKGSGTIAGVEVGPGTVHFTEKRTPYGPIIAGPDGLMFMIIRPYHTTETSNRTPTAGVIEKVRQAQKRDAPR